MYSSLGYATLPDFVISTGQTNSNSLEIGLYAHDAVAIGIVAPGTLPETVTIQVSCDGGTTWGTLNNGSSDIGAPQAGKARNYKELMGFTHMRLVSGAGVADVRTFQAGKVYKG